jgi:hypothetical protein
MNKTVPDKITVTVSDSSCDDKIEISLNKYSNIDDWIKVFKTILIHQTFCENTVKELFEDPWEEYDKIKDKSDLSHYDYKEYPLPTSQDLNEIEYQSTFNEPPSTAWWKSQSIGTPVGKEAW